MFSEIITCIKLVCRKIALPGTRSTVIALAVGLALRQQQRYAIAMTILTRLVARPTRDAIFVSWALGICCFVVVVVVVVVACIGLLQLVEVGSNPSLFGHRPGNRLNDDVLAQQAAHGGWSWSWLSSFGLCARAKCNNGNSKSPKQNKTKQNKTKQNKKQSNNTHSACNNLYRRFLNAKSRETTRCCCASLSSCPCSVWPPSASLLVSTSKIGMCRWTAPTQMTAVGRHRLPPFHTLLGPRRPRSSCFRRRRNRFLAKAIGT